VSRTQKTKFDAKKKQYAVVSLPSERVQILRCSLWGLGEKNRPEPPHIFGGNGHFVGLRRTHAGSKYGSIVSDLKPLYRGAKVIVVRAKWFITGSGLTKQQVPAGPKRHTAVDSFGKRAVVVTAASVPEGQASKQVLSFGLPDGTKGSTGVFDLGRWR